MSLMEMQEKKIELEALRVAVKKRKEDFIILHADTSNMDEEMKAAHKFLCETILVEMGLRRAPSSSSTVSTAAQMKPRSI
jgi:hypothetical protein